MGDNLAHIEVLSFFSANYKTKLKLTLLHMLFFNKILNFRHKKDLTDSNKELLVVNQIAILTVIITLLDAGVLAVCAKLSKGTRTLVSGK